MKAHVLSRVDKRPVAISTFLGVLALMIISTPADATICGVMKMPPPQWRMPMHPPLPYAKHKAMPYWPKYSVGNRAGPSVIDVAKRKGEFGTLLTAVEAAGLTGLLEGDGPYTLFAPTDAAFQRLPEGALQELLSDKSKLISVLKHHVVPGRVTAVKVLESRELKTASSEKLPTADLSVIRADIPARNGIIHVIDKVILPSG